MTVRHEHASLHEQTHALPSPDRASRQRRCRDDERHRAARSIDEGPELQEPAEEELDASLRCPILPVDALQEAVIDHPPDVLRRSLDRHPKFIREGSQVCVSLGRDRVQDEHRRRLAKVAQQLHGDPEPFNTVKRIGHV